MNVNFLSMLKHYPLFCACANLKPHKNNEYTQTTLLGVEAPVLEVLRMNIQRRMKGGAGGALWSVISAKNEAMTLVTFRRRPYRFWQAITQLAKTDTITVSIFDR